jgi:hypothetical protein
MQLFQLRLQFNFALLKVLFWLVWLSVPRVPCHTGEIDGVYACLDLCSSEGDDSFAPLLDRLLVFADFRVCDNLGDKAW